jgi:hypothetical protein
MTCSSHTTVSYTKRNTRMNDKEKKSYNVGAEMFRQGLLPRDSEMNLDDMDVVEALDLSPSLAYTPEINVEAAKVQRQRNIINGMTAGQGKGKAIAQADAAYNEARKLARKLYSPLNK